MTYHSEGGDPNLKLCKRCGKLWDINLGHKCWTRMEGKCSPLYWYMLQYDPDTRHTILGSSGLTERERSMLILCIGLDGQPPRKHTTIMDILKVSDRVAKRIKDTAYRKVKVYIVTEIMKVDLYAIDDEDTGVLDPL